MRRPEELKAANITHVLSVLKKPLDGALFEGYKHLLLPVDDKAGINLIEHFKTTNEWIDKGLAEGKGVLVHCAMGISRSVTIVTAYMIYKKGLSADEALEYVRASRTVACPNLGFRKQLQFYYENLDAAVEDLTVVPTYKRFLYLQEVDNSISEWRAPKIEYYVEDGAVDGGGEQAGGAGDKGVKCRKCRRTLAPARALVEHNTNLPVTDSAKEVIKRTPSPQVPCQIHFVDPVAWMRPEFEKGLSEGYLECPKCSAKIGCYVWQGMECSCGEWFVPGISLGKEKTEFGDSGRFNLKGGGLPKDIISHVYDMLPKNIPTTMIQTEGIANRRDDAEAPLVVGLAFVAATEALEALAIDDCASKYHCGIALVGNPWSFRLVIVAPEYVNTCCGSMHGLSQSAPQRLFASQDHFSQQTPPGGTHWLSAQVSAHLGQQPGRPAGRRLARQLSPASQQPTTGGGH
ncbi:hypothetical protein ABW20_dc0107959 [Dactylellina cionopaga]|nr:hypothetical protein ABW20_dc0107959 [Dactylellina cionopaga]